MPDPYNEPPQSGEAGPGRTHQPGDGALEEGLTPDELDERHRNTSTTRKPMGPPPPEDDRSAGALDDDFPEQPHVPPTTPD
jgi:hypothetical protein